MPDSPILFEIVLVFGAALAVIAISHRLRIPAVVGFLLAGVLIGPYGLALVPDTRHVEAFAELAVALMLFVIGLELSTSELRRLGRLFVFGGALQAALTMAIGVSAALLLGAEWPLALFCGFVLTLSSTAIVLKIYTDRREIEAPHGRLALGILLFQDILIVPMLLIVPVLAGGGGFSSLAVLGRLAEGLAVVAGVILAGRYLVPTLLGFLARTGIRELLLLAGLFACLGTALITHHLGLSMALGSFLAGVALADADLRHQMQAQIAPLRDVFSSIFFTSIGMLLSLSVLVANLGWILAATTAILAVKALVVWLVARMLRFPPRPAVIAALGLCQIGEFSFVLLQAGKSEGILPQGLYALLIAASVSTMLLTPLMMTGASRLASWISGRSPRDPAAPEADGEALHNHVVIGGWGLGGRLLSRILGEGGIRYRIVDLDATVVEAARSQGEAILLGDIATHDIQLKAGIDQAKVAVFAISDRAALRQAISLARWLNPGLHIIVRTKQVDAIEELARLGADEIVTQDLETCIEIVRRVFGRLRLPRQLIRTAESYLHEDHYAALLAPRPRTGLSKVLLSAATSGLAESFVLPPGHDASGRSIREVDLRRATGVTILAVLRGDGMIAHPKPDLVLRDGDTLVLVGDHSSLDSALLELENPSSTAEAGPSLIFRETVGAGPSFRKP